MKILISAYSCSPYRGSEPGMGWLIANGISQRHQVWVITTEEYRHNIEKYQKDNPNTHLTIVYFELPKFLFKAFAKWKYGRFYYYLWQLFAERKVQQLHQQVSFELVHHVTFASYWRPSCLSRLKVPFVWGSVGGSARIPRQFRNTLSDTGRLAALLKIAVEWASSHIDPFVRRVFRHATIAVAATPKTAAILAQLGIKHIRLVAQIALPDEDLDTLEKMPLRDHPEVFRLISLGRLIDWKGLTLAVRAFANFHQRYPASEYLIVGDGPELSTLQQLISELHLTDFVKILEKRTRQQALACLQDSDALVYPCLLDQPGWVCLEGMAAARPVIYLYGRPYDVAAARISLEGRTDSVDYAITDMADNMFLLATNPELSREIGQASRKYVRDKFSVDGLITTYESIYQEALQIVRSVAP